MRKSFKLRELLHKIFTSRSSGIFYKEMTPGHVDYNTPEKLKLREDLYKVFPQEKEFNVSSDEIAPEGNISGTSVVSFLLHVKRGALRFTVKNEVISYSFTMPPNSYVLFPKGKHSGENFSKELPCLYSTVSTRPKLTNGEIKDTWREDINENMEHAAQIFAESFPGIQRIIPTVEKSATLPGIDAVTK